MKIRKKSDVQQIVEQNIDIIDAMKKLSQLISTKKLEDRDVAILNKIDGNK